ncbi:MAG: ComEC/Rec2 family competence protein [Chloroflexi bacterium]|nr:ComEC/Rec2 family competence protein [Chloroflexota bacterium]
MRLLWLSGAFVTGAWLGIESGGGWDPPLAALLLWAVAIALVFAHERAVGRQVFPALVVLFLLLGLVRVSTTDPAVPLGDPFAAMSAGPVEFEAVLDTEPRPYGGVTRLPLSVTMVIGSEGETDDLESSVRVDVLADDLFGASEPLRGFRYGDAYRISGRFQPRSPDVELPPGISPDATGVVTAATVQLIDSTSGNDFRRAVADARGAASASILKTVPGAASGLATAVTTGDRTGLTPDLRDDFRSAGMSHLLAISGLHVAIVAGLALAVAARLIGRRRQLYLIVPFAAVLSYAVLAGLSPSVTRAAVMASVYLLAIALGRQRSALPAIAFAAAAMTLIDPRSVGTLSFQLSFAAVLGIAVLEPQLRGRMDALTGRFVSESSPVRGPALVLSRGLGFSLAATIATMPLVGSTFDEVPVLGALATVVALPAVPVLIVASGGVAVIEPLSSIAAAPVGWLAWLSAGWLITVAGGFSNVPGGTVSTAGWGAGLIAGWYGTIFVWLGRRRVRGVAELAPGLVRSMSASTRIPGRRSLSWLAVPAIAVAVLPWIAVSQLPGDRLRVTFFETDRGDMILVETSTGTQALIDGGRASAGATQSLGRTLPFWDRSIDVVVLTHSDADHVGGLLDVLELYEVGVVIDTTAEADTEVFGEWRDQISTRTEPVATARRGMVIALDSVTTLEVVWAGTDELADTNAASTVLMLRHGDVRMLLTGDIPRSVESRLVSGDASVAADLLKAPHHGSDTSSSARFLDAVAPSAIVVPTGTRNPFGHPDEDVLARFSEHAPEAPVFITKERGDVTVETDGRRMWVTTKR